MKLENGHGEHTGLLRDGRIGGTAAVCDNDRILGASAGNGAARRVPGLSAASGS
ncbi:hypothetical protein D3C85_1854830 [compost metagenome]